MEYESIKKKTRNRKINRQIKKMAEGRRIRCNWRKKMKPRGRGKN